jgi:hypothetical protein
MDAQNERATFLALADRCEQAAGPDRKLDGAVWCAANGYPFVKWDGAGAVWRGADGSIQHRAAYRVPPYTASLETAIALVPEGCEWLRKNPESMTVYRVPDDLKEWAQHIYGRGATPALALCAAALRARAAAHD